MINLRSTCLLLGMMCLASFSFGQAIPGVDSQNLQDLIQQLRAENLEESENKSQKASALGLPLRLEHSDGSVSELERFEGDFPVYVTTNNRIAAISTATLGLLPGGSTGYDLSGAGMIIGEWDGGAVRLTHQEFGGRAIQRDGATSISNHATHVAGTLMGSGVREDAMGMAPQATLWAHDWNSDNAEMADAASRGLLVSNHSYGNLAGWANGDWSNPGTTEWHWWGDVSISEQEDYKFGFYDGKTAAWDQIAASAPYYLIVKSAGNDRNNAGAVNHKVFINGEWQSSTEVRPRDGGQLGYDCLPTYSNAKNILTIGAVNDLPNGYAGPASVSISNFSSFGPTDDGRIKPDIVGNGVGLTSSTSAGDDTYGSLSGTSMSGPNVAGSLILLQELYQRYNNRFMLSSTLRGLAIQTADEAGNTPGPDYRFGWGLLNSTRAADMIHDNGVFQFMEEKNLMQNEASSTEIFVNGTDSVKITLCWIDPAGSVSSPALNDRTPKLVNDLDIRLISNEDTSIVFFPYLLNPDDPAAAAIQADNFRDNVEQIDAGILPAGTYTIRITHKGNLAGGSQWFSLLSNTPKTPCQLGIAQDVSVELLCGENTLAEFTVPGIEEGVAYEYSLDNQSFQPDPTFYELAAGTYQFWIRDENGCIGLQRLRIEPAVELVLTLEDESVFYAENDGLTSTLAYGTSYASGWGANPFSTFISADAVFATDDSANGTQGCGSLVNSAELTGRIAVFDRGGCEFGAKALKAQQAGALAAIIINNAAGAPAQMGPGAVGNLVNIPVFMITQEDGQALRNAINSGLVSFTFGTIRAMQPATCAQLEDGAVRPVLNAGSSDNVTFMWSNGTQTLHNENLAAGVYVLTITDESGCDTTFEYTVFNQPEPEILLEWENETCLNEGDGSFRIINPPSLQNFRILLNDEDIETMDINRLRPGNYEVTLIDTTNTCTYFTDFEIQQGYDFDLSEISGEETVIESIPYTYSVDPVPGATYFWESVGGSVVNGQGTPVAELQFLSVPNPYVKVKVQLEQCIKTTEKSVEINTTTVVNLHDNTSVKVMPNPFGQYVYVESDAEGKGPIQLELINMINQRVRQLTISGAGRTQMDTGDLLPGMYILNASDGQNNKAIKLIKHE
jgi:hypothetical protein